MKLIYFKAKDFKNLNIEFRFDGKSVVIHGKNGAGKSSVIDAIKASFGMLGKVKEPIQKGKKLAEVTSHVELDKDYTYNKVTLKKGTVLVCERMWSEEATKLTVRPQGGKPLGSPKDLLDFILGISSIPDPSQLVNMKPLEQKKFVEEILGIDTTDIEARKRKALDDIEDVQQEVTAAEKEVSAIVIPAGKWDKERSMDEIRDLQNKVNERIQNKTTRENNIKNGQRALDDNLSRQKEIPGEIENNDRRILEIMEENNKLKGELENLKSKEQVFNDHLEKLRAVIDEPDESEDVQAKVEEINRHNENYKLVQRKKVLQDMLSNTNDDLRSKREGLKAIEQERLNMLKGKKLIAGLKITDDGITFEDLPITEEQLSEAKRLELWMDVLMALHPNLKLIWFKNGSAFDDAAKERIYQKADDNGYMVLMEEVTNEEDLSINFIENIKE